MKKRFFWKLWGIPIIIGICSAIGLVSALTGDGFFDLISWLSLGLPIALTIWYISKPKSKHAVTKSR